MAGYSGTPLPQKLGLKPNLRFGSWSGPKKASGVKTDVSENDVRKLGLSAGLVDNKVCAIDEVWSGLRLVVRVRDRPK